MNRTATTPTEYRAIAKTVQAYIDGAISGRSEDMRPAFHPDATVLGHFGGELLAGPIGLLFEWHDANGPAAGLEAHIAAIDVVGTVATVRLELYDWTGYRFTDLFTMLKTDGDWRIANKVFHLHA